ncbi:mycofactocin-coupled SDR family oxidoreductase [Speluncibacter jeojiensis]|uniref:Mycofactocin-coupled SDR family oxidoreductase n=1 Tax=Speluncibacter jeojiensis TaxID=2710754 RepID=A0A9X4RDL6_9ACTN|nr:mycofactocin-coupled SDR family oxidoreductase [Corynebacteriales bacterium D3-21]
MSGRVTDKVAFVTGAARGQGRSHALRLAEEGADIIALDLAGGIDSVTRFYPPATAEDLAETVRGVERLGRRIIADKADVRDFDAVRSIVDRGIAELGRIDIVVANAGIFISGEPAHRITEEEWDDVLDVNLKGVWHTCKAAIPHLIEQGEGGSIVLTSSTAGIKGPAKTAAYASSKHAVVGLMRALTNELGEYRIRVNTVHPGATDTPMIINDRCYGLFLPGVEHPAKEQVAPMFAATNAIPVPWVEPVDVSNAVLFLASDEARYVTGTELKVDAGFTTR